MVAEIGKAFAIAIIASLLGNLAARWLENKSRVVRRAVGGF